MTDPVNPQITTPIFNLNLETNAEADSDVVSEPQMKEQITPEVDNDRLQKEDELVEEHIKPIEAPTIITNEITENKNEKTDFVVKKVEEEVVPKTDLQKDLQIIQNLETNQKEIIQKKDEQKISGNGLNLDTISMELPKAWEKTLIWNTPNTPNIQANPYDNLQKSILQESLIETNNYSERKKSWAIGIVIIVWFILLGWFVIKTMYPIQYKDVVSSLSWNNEGEISGNITWNIEEELDGTGNELIDENNFGNKEDFLDSELLDSSVLEWLSWSWEEFSWENHNAAEEIIEPSIMEESSIIEEQKNTKEDFEKSLEGYKTKGRMILEEAKKNEDKEQMKYSLALSKKAEWYLQNIANGKEMSSIEMETIISELSGYLNKLTPIDVSIPTEEATMTQTNESWSEGFNSESFFWNTED